MKKIFLFLLLAVNLTAFSQATFSSQSIYIADNQDSVRLAGIIKAGSVWTNRTFWAIDIVKNRLKISDTLNMLLPYATKQYLLNTTYTQAQANALFSPIGHVHPFSSLTSRPTTLSGYGITDAAPLVHTHSGVDITTGTVADARLSTTVTKQGNSFNAANQLVQMDGAGKLPAVDGSQLLNLPGGSGGTVTNNYNIPFIYGPSYGITVGSNIVPRLQTVIDSLKSLGKKATIILANGDYYAWNTVKATGYYVPRILLHGTGISIRGESEFGTIIHFKGTGGTDPQTNFDTFYDSNYPTDSVITRSPGIQIKSDISTDTLRDIWIENLTLDGGCWNLKYNNSYPTFKDQTNQWDIGHKAINIYADGSTHTDGIHIWHVYTKNWMGEHIYSGGNAHKLIDIQWCKAHNANASLYSLGGSLNIQHCDVDSGVNGMECYTGPGKSIISDNRVHDMWDSTGSKANGIVWGGATVTAYDDMEAVIDRNITWNIPKVGYYSLRMNREVKISNNVAIDCGVGIAVEPFDESVEGIDIVGNTIKSKFKTVGTGIAIFGGGSSGLLNDNIAIHDNYIYPTDTGKTASHYITNGIQFYNTKGDASIFNNLINAHTNGLVDGQFGANTVNYPRQYGNRYVDAEFTNGVNLSSGATLTIWPLEKFGITNFTDGSFTVNVDCDPAKALTGTEMTVTKLDALTQYTFQSSNTHFDLATSITLSAVNDWVTFKKGKTGKWEFQAKRQR